MLYYSSARHYCKLIHIPNSPIDGDLNADYNVTFGQSPTWFENLPR